MNRNNQVLIGPEPDMDHVLKVIDIYPENKEVDILSSMEEESVKKIMNLENTLHVLHPENEKKIFLDGEKIWGWSDKKGWYSRVLNFCFYSDMDSHGELKENTSEKCILKCENGNPNYLKIFSRKLKKKKKNSYNPLLNQIKKNFPKESVPSNEDYETALFMTCGETPFKVMNVYNTSEPINEEHGIYPVTKSKKIVDVRHVNENVMKILSRRAYWFGRSKSISPALKVLVGEKTIDEISIQKKRNPKEVKKTIRRSTDDALTIIYSLIPKKNYHSNQLAGIRKTGCPEIYKNEFLSNCQTELNYFMYEHPKMIAVELNRKHKTKFSAYQIRDCSKFCFKTI